PRLCALLQAGALLFASAGNLRHMAGRHVVSRRLPWRARGGGLLCPAPTHQLGGADWLPRPPRAHRPPPPTPPPLYQRRALGPRHRRAVGHGVSRWRTRAAPSLAALRDGAGRDRALHAALVVFLAQAPAHAGLGALPRRLRRREIGLRARPRARQFSR